MENHLRSNLIALDLGQYIDVLQQNGFVDWDTLSKAGEEDLGRLGFKLGHRRRLQRELASKKGLPYRQPLDNGSPTEQGVSSSGNGDITQSSSSSTSSGSISG
ncbi:hmg box protein [Paraphaeosphaeria sporulosa]